MLHSPLFTLSPRKRHATIIQEKIKKDTTIGYFDRPQGEQRMVLDILSELPDGFEIVDYQEWQNACARDLCRVTVAEDKLDTFIKDVTERSDGRCIPQETGESYLRLLEI